MREIRFRGKRLDNGEWVYGYLIGKDVIVGDIVEFCEEYFTCEYWWRVDPKTVGQSTGLKDKNGKEIYEGDVIETEKMEYSDSGHYIGMVKVLGKVVFSNGRYALHLETGAMPDLSFALSFHEIIGNIHDHPHLLKGA
jgi:uncharacterized phage protein (TIGR01671 family)